MTLKQRIKKLEEHLPKIYSDPSVDAELTQWLQSHPGFCPLTSPENDGGIVMPEHLRHAFQRRIERLFAERGLPKALSSLLEIIDDLF